MKLKEDRFRPWQFMLSNLKDPRTYRHPIHKLLPFWLRGFSTEHILLLGLTSENWRHFTQDAIRYRITNETNKHVWPLLHDKLAFDSFMQDKLPVTSPLFAIVEGKFHPLQPDFTLDAFVAELKNGGRFVIKPTQGGKGFGMMFLQGAANDVEVNGKPMSYHELNATLQRLPYQICYSFIEQHPEIARLYPASSNTLRMTGFLGLDGQPRLLATVLRAGSKEAAPLDSFFRGGILTFIDDETGVCTKGLVRDGKDGVMPIEAHPETGDRFIGIQVPFWKEIRAKLLSFHATYPAFDLVGWDVLVGKEGFHILEGNHNPGLRLPLMFRNL